MDNEILIKILERLSSIETSIKDLMWVKDDVQRNSKDIVELKTIADNQQKEIDEIKENNKWLRRGITTMIIGLVSSGVVALITYFVG